MNIDNKLQGKIGFKKKLVHFKCGRVQFNHLNKQNYLLTFVSLTN